VGAARGLLASIPDASAYHAQAAKAISDAAIEGDAPVKVAHAPAAKPAKPTKPTEPAKPTEPPQPAPPTMSFEQAMNHARDDANAHNWAAALQHAQIALASRTDHEAQMIATKAACSLNRPDLARRYLAPASTGSFHDLAVSHCENLGIALE
jgi:hypothetical protein